MFEQLFSNARCVRDELQVVLQNWLGIGIVVLLFTYQYITADPKYGR